MMSGLDVLNPIFLHSELLAFLVSRFRDLIDAHEAATSVSELVVL